MRKYFLLILLFLNPEFALADGLPFDLGGDLTSRVFQMIFLITILSLAPSILIMVTCFTRIIVVFSFLRSAIGLQQSPPNSVLISLALFLTFFIMGPVFEKSYKEGVVPLIEGKITEEQALVPVVGPFKEFMLKNVKEKDLELFLQISKTPKLEKPEEVPIQALVPAFMISELKRAFEIGFLIFIPFLVIDIAISAILMAMGMMMLPPVMISMPFKIIFFVIIDGWYLICGNLVKSFGV